MLKNKLHYILWRGWKENFSKQKIQSSKLWLKRNFLAVSQTPIGLSLEYKQVFG